MNQFPNQNPNQYSNRIHNQYSNRNQNQNQSLNEHKYQHHNPMHNSYQNQNQNQNQYQNQNNHQPKYNEKLPVFGYKDMIKKAILKNSITLLVGQTGSGKTTQIPQYLFEWNDISAANKIVCTQPRRLAAKSVAERVSFEHSGNYVSIGQTVGYHIRLDKCLNDDITKLVYMTEGVLLRKAMNDNLLNGYRVVIIDEAHERTVNADLLMGFLKKTVEKRKDLRVVIMSATLDEARFSKYFHIPKKDILHIPGSAFPVQHYWLNSPTDNYIELVKKIINAIHNDDRAFEYDKIKINQQIPDGHILVFLTGQQEIENVVREFKRNNNNNYNNQHKYGFELEVYPLYAALGQHERKKAFDKPHNNKTRKCVVSTNIAETSLTINNVMYVIDTGLSKQKIYSSSKGIEALGVRCISKASVKQRIGRAGRVKPGIAYHLYTRIGFESFPNETSAEIIRSGLVSETLSMLALGMDNPLKFDFIDAPDEMTMARAMNTLYNLGAIDDNRKITEYGKKMARFPLKPELACAILKSCEYNCSYEIIVIAAMLEIYDRLWLVPRDNHRRAQFKRQKSSFFHISGDHLTLLNIYNAYKQIRATSPNNFHKFCMDNFLDKHSLKRADQIKKQFEQTLCRVQLDDMKSNNNNNNNVDICTFKLYPLKYKKYYDNIIKCLLYGYFMNTAVKAFGDKFWTFRVLTLDKNEKTIDPVDKAVIHRSSVFSKIYNRNWIIFNEIQISNTTQLKIITAIKPIWLIQSNKKYFDISKLQKCQSPIAKVLIETAHRNNLL